MSKQNPPGGGADQLRGAQSQVEQAKRRFSSTLGALQYRLKPGTLANHAWVGVRDKSSEIADETLHSVNGMADTAVKAVKERPVAASGIAAAVLIFLARGPLWRLVSRPFSNRAEEDEGVVTTNLDDHQGRYDLTAPSVEASLNEGVSA